jgi:hypothetical protein
MGCFVSLQPGGGKELFSLQAMLLFLNQERSSLNKID